LKQGASDKTKKTYLSLATLAIVLLLSAALVVPSLAYADGDHGKKDSRGNDDKSHEKDRKDKGDHHDKDNHHKHCEHQDDDKYKHHCDE
jgi:hypothetical protein